MKKLLSFIKENIHNIILMITILFIFWAIFYLNNIEMSIYILGVQISIFLYVIYLVIIFFSYKNKKSLEKTIDDLENECRQIKYEYNSNRREIREYFMMWIHQIKTPITASKLILESEDIDIGELSRQLFYIDDYTNMALNYLKISEFERDMSVCNIPLDNIIKPILRKYSIIFINHKISLEYESIEDSIVTDSKWFGILIEQIVSNAVKYTKNGVVGIKFYNDEDNNSVLEIYDTGIGISKEDLPKIFDNGYSGLNGRLNQKSSGIGLFLAKQIADKLNIEIKVKSQIGEGSNFFIVIKNT